MTPYTILVVTALVLSVVGIIKPAWPVVAVAVLLIGVACLVKGG